MTDPRGSRTERRYDSLERMYLQIDLEAGQDNHQRSFAYDALGNLTAQTDTNQHTTTYGYNPLQKLSRVTDALGNATRYEYDANGNLVRTVNAAWPPNFGGYAAKGSSFTRLLMNAS